MDPSESEHGITGPVDLEALALHVTSLSGELERSWSDALDEATLDPAQKELSTELSAFVTTMTGALKETDAKLQDAGVDPRIYTWPFDPDAFKQLEASSDPERQRTNLVIAQMIALRSLLAAFQALQEPGGHHLDFRTGSHRQWFEAGAFSLFRERAAMLLRITREVDRVTEILLQQTPTTVLDLSVEAASESLQAARGAFARGDIDAALLHSGGALRGVLESLPFILAGDERLKQPATLLAEVPSLGEYASALRLLDSEVAALVFRRADLGVGVPLVDGLLPVIATVVHEPPIVELQEILSADRGDG